MFQFDGDFLQAVHHSLPFFFGNVECFVGFVGKRERRMSILLSEDEQQIVDRYLDKYKITNKSRWLRETILMFIHKNMEEDYPTLFGEHDMRR